VEVIQEKRRVNSSGCFTSKRQCRARRDRTAMARPAAIFIISKPEADSLPIAATFREIDP
jgi:hypothetical protein